MGIQKRKEKKKKDREKRVKEKVLEKRITIRSSAKHEKQVWRIEKKSRHRQKPYVNAEKRDMLIKEQIEHNLEIIKALEEEYANAEQVRKEINEELEQDGCLTIKDKLSALEDKKNETLNIDENYSYEELKV